jgi:hypothetical protein
MKGEPVTERLQGYLLSFAPDEYKEINKALEEWGYEPNSDGLKTFILDEVGGERPYKQGKSIGQHIGQFMEDNPEIVSGVIGKAFRMVSGVRVKRR